ncbi:MAG: FG-GAP repeat domain-containing protein [Planctomycetota bacterium]
MRIYIFTVLAFLLLAFGARAQNFLNQQYAAGDSPEALVAADFNADGNADAAVCNSSSNNVSILYGDGAGGFLLPVNYSVAAAPMNLAAADINNDGKLDLAAASILSSNFSVLLAQGGGFASTIHSPCANGTKGAFALGDITNDGKADLVTFSSTVNFIRIIKFAGNGAGGFVHESFFPATIVVSDLELSDTNADSKLDLVAGANSNFYVFLGNGTGGFGAPAAFPSGVGESFVMKDLNQNGVLDVAKGINDSEISILLGNGAGGFAPQIQYSISHYTNSIDAGDIDNNGSPDIVVADYGTTGLATVLSWAGGSTFSLGAVIHAGMYISDLKLAELDNDGDLDLITTNQESGRITVSLGDGAGSFITNSRYFAAPLITNSMQSFDLIDLNGDGFPDAVTANGNHQTISVLLGNGTGGFLAPALFTAAEKPRVVRLGDLNGDGDPDAAHVSFMNPVVTVRFGDGAGGVGAPQSYNILKGTTDLNIHDLNGDGAPDLLAGMPAPHSFFSILFGAGNGNFNNPVNFPTSGGPAWATAAGDLNHDGALDIIISDSSNDGIRVSLAAGGGSFAPSVFYSVPNSPGGVAIGDLNADGNLDVVESNANEEYIYIFSGNGSGTLSSAVIHNTPGVRASDFAIGDMNADGRTDITVSSGYTDNMTILRGQPGGIYSDGGSYSIASNYEICISDLDADGHTDVVGIYHSELTVALYQTPAPVSVFNYGMGTFGCDGAVGLTASAEPKVNTPNFGFTSTNAPPNSLGLLIATDIPDFSGMDIFGIGAVIHLNVAASTEIFLLDIISDASGTGFAPVPIPNNPSIIGNQYYAQSLWYESTAKCTPSFLGFVTSIAVGLQIQP